MVGGLRFQKYKSLRSNDCDYRNAVIMESHNKRNGRNYCAIENFSFGAALEAKQKELVDKLKSVIDFLIVPNVYFASIRMIIRPLNDPAKVNSFHSFFFCRFEASILFLK